jgi:hypothetical protein
VCIVKKGVLCVPDFVNKELHKALHEEKRIVGVQYMFNEDELNQFALFAFAFMTNIS